MGDVALTVKGTRMFAKCLCLANGNGVVFWQNYNLNYDVYFIIIDGDGNKISTTEILVGASINDKWEVRSFNDSSFVIIYLIAGGFSGNFLYGQYYDSTGHAIYVDATCHLKITVDRYDCMHVIENCEDQFVNQTCGRCSANYSLTSDTFYCVPTLIGCISYKFDIVGKCSQCQATYLLDDIYFTCYKEIENCSTYTADYKCHVCKNSFVVTASAQVCVPEIMDCLTYTIDTNCSVCAASLILTADKRECMTPIANCETYSDDTNCSQCAASLILTNDKRECMTPLENCDTYSDDKKCSQCAASLILTNDKMGCMTPITNCSIYSDDTNCSKCADNLILTNGKRECMMPIADCETYSDDKKCEQCTTLILSNDNLTCHLPIEYCVTYSTDDKCLTCNSTKILSTGHLACASEILNCSVYTDQNTCETCESGFISTDEKNKCFLNIPYCRVYASDYTCSNCSIPRLLTTDKKICFDSISDCLQYNSNKCSLCGDKKLKSFNGTACVTAIIDCLQHSDDGKCLVCMSGTDLSSDNSSCNENLSTPSQLKKTILSKLSINNTNSSNGSILLEKDSQNLSIIEVINNYNQSFRLSLNQAKVTFTNGTSNSTHEVPATALNSSVTQLLRLSVNLLNISKGNYSVDINIWFSTNNMRILQNTSDSETLPDNFVLNYQPSDMFYVYVAGEEETATKNDSTSNENSNGDDEFNYDYLAAIFLSVFGFFLLVGIVAFVIYKKRQSKAGGTNFQALPFSPNNKTDNPAITI